MLLGPGVVNILETATANILARASAALQPAKFIKSADENPAPPPITAGRLLAQF
jgi:hypothetical protein